MRLTKFMLLLMNDGEQSFAEWLRQNYDNWVRLLQVDGSSLIGGANDTHTGTIVTIDGKDMLDGYYDVGDVALTINSKTFTFEVTPDAVDVSTTAAYIFQFYIDANNLIRGYFSTTAGQLIIEYIGQSVSETITLSSQIQDKTLYGQIMVPNTTEDMLLYINGLLRGAVTLANDVSGTDIDNVNTAIGASDTSGTNAIGGYVGEVQVNDNEETYFTNRYQAIYAKGYNNPYSFHSLYKAVLDGIASTLIYGTAISAYYNGQYTLDFRFTPNSYAINDVLFSISSGRIYIQYTGQSNNKISFKIIILWVNTIYATWDIGYELTINEENHLVISYDYTSLAADPYVEVNDVAVTVTETISPSGTPYSLSANNTYLGSFKGTSYFADVSFRSFAVFSEILDSAGRLALSDSNGRLANLNNHPNADSLVVWTNMDYIDSAGNISYVDNAGSGTFPDATGGGNDATPQNMDHDNMAEVDADPTAYLANVNSVTDWDVAYIGYGAGLKIYGGAAITTVNTAFNQRDYLGLSRIAFGKTANSYADLYNGGSGQITGTIPATMTMRFRVVLDNWADSALNVICRIEEDANNYYELRKNTSNQLEFVHVVDSTSVSLTYSVSGFAGIHDVAVTITSSAIALYVDGTSRDSDTVSAAPDGSISLAIIGADTLTPTNEMDADLVEGWFDLDTALSATQITTINGYLGR